MCSLKYIFKIMIAAAAALIVWEAVLENCVLRDPGGVSSPVLGRIPRNGVYLQGTEGYCKTELNSLGMRGMEIPAKAPAEYRILILGDSYTEALQVSDDKTFTHLLQIQLGRITGRDVRIVNAGRNGASPAYYIHLSDFYNASIDPDFVIVQLNDEDFTTEIMDNKTREFYVKQEGGSYITETNFKDYYLWQMFPHLKLIKPFVAFSTFKIALDKIPAMLDQRRGVTASARQVNMMDNSYESIVDWTLKTLKNDYPRMAILYLTMNKCESDMESFVRRYANKYDIDIVNSRDIFLNYYSLNCQPVNGFNNTMPGTGHMNDIGHTMVGNSLTEYFIRNVFK